MSGSLTNPSRDELATHLSQSATANWFSWVWPVPTISKTDGTAPVAAIISQEYKPGKHNGLDIMYKGAHNYYAPEGTIVLAARAGTVFGVTPSARGLQIVLDHHVPWATYYQHLVSACVSKGDVVREGDPIGIMGFDPTDPEKIRHLHFEVWYQGGADHSLDPTPVMSYWKRVSQISGWAPTLVTP